MDCCRDEDEWQKRHPLLGSITPEQREHILTELLDRMRKALCIKTIYLDPNFQEQIRNRSFNQLKEPWGLSEEERLFSHAYMVPRPSPRGQPRNYRVCTYRPLCFRTADKSQATWGRSKSSLSSEVRRALTTKLSTTS